MISGIVNILGYCNYNDLFADTNQYLNKMKYIRIYFVSILYMTIK